MDKVVEFYSCYVDFVFMFLMVYEVWCYVVWFIRVSEIFNLLRKFFNNGGDECDFFKMNKLRDVLVKFWDLIEYLVSGYMSYRIFFSFCLFIFDIYIFFFIKNISYLVYILLL